MSLVSSCCRLSVCIVLPSLGTITRYTCVSRNPRPAFLSPPPPTCRSTTAASHALAPPVSFQLSEQSSLPLLSLVLELRPPGKSEPTNQQSRDTGSGGADKRGMDLFCLSQKPAPALFGGVGVFSVQPLPAAKLTEPPRVGIGCTGNHDTPPPRDPKTLPPRTAGQSRTNSRQKILHHQSVRKRT